MNRQTYDPMLVVQTETIVLFLGNTQNQIFLLILAQGRW